MKDSGFGLRAPCDAYFMESDEADFLKDHERALSELSEWAGIYRRHGLDIIEQERGYDRAALWWPARSTTRIFLACGFEPNSDLHSKAPSCFAMPIFRALWSVVLSEPKSTIEKH